MSVMIIFALAIFSRHPRRDSWVWGNLVGASAIDFDGWWVVAGFRGVGGRWDSGFRISLDRKITIGFWWIYLCGNLYFIHISVGNSNIYIPLFTRSLFWRLLKI